MFIEKDFFYPEEEERWNLIARVLAGVLVRVVEREIPSLRAAMGDEAFESMLKKFFPRMDPSVSSGSSEFNSPAFRSDEYDEVYSLLMRHRNLPGDEGSWIASCISLACQGRNHLWQDMGLDDRGMLSDVFRTFFRELAKLNDKDMKWKKFLYRQLCEEDGLKCRAPSCGLCSDINNCFGPEV